MRPIEIICPNRHFLPVKACLAHFIVIVRVLGHNWAFGELVTAKLWLSCGELASIKGVISTRR